VCINRPHHLQEKAEGKSTPINLIHELTLIFGGAGLVHTISEGFIVNPAPNELKLT
jgi:hypothetical protein